MSLPLSRPTTGQDADHALDAIQKPNSPGTDPGFSRCKGLWATPSTSRPAYNFAGIKKYIEAAAAEAGPDGRFRLEWAQDSKWMRGVVNCLTNACTSGNKEVHAAQLKQALRFRSSMAVALAALDASLIDVSGELGVEISFLPEVPTEQPTPLTD
jgi:hypothetical protein